MHALAAEINALLTDCTVQLQADGSPTPNTQLQHWPRYAPPLKRLHIYMPADRPHPFVAFLGSCMQQELAVRLLRGVQSLYLNVSGCSRL